MYVSWLLSLCMTILSLLLLLLAAAIVMIPVVQVASRKTSTDYFSAGLCFKRSCTFSCTAAVPVGCIQNSDCTTELHVCCGWTNHDPSHSKDEIVGKTCGIQLSFFAKKKIKNYLKKKGEEKRSEVRSKVKMLPRFKWLRLARVGPLPPLQLAARFTCAAASSRSTDYLWYGAGADGRPP